MKTIQEFERKTQCLWSQLVFSRNIQIHCEERKGQKISESPVGFGYKALNCLICIFHLLFKVVFFFLLSFNFRWCVNRYLNRKKMVRRQMNWTTNLVTESIILRCPRNTVTGGNKRKNNNANGTINKVLVDFNPLFQSHLNLNERENEHITIHWM